MTEEYPLAPEQDIRDAVSELINVRIPQDAGLAGIFREVYTTDEGPEVHIRSLGTALVALSEGHAPDFDLIGEWHKDVPMNTLQFTSTANHIFEALDDRGANKLTAAIKAHTGTLHSVLVEKKYRRTA